MFGKKKSPAPKADKRRQTVGGEPAAMFTVRCTNGCTRLDCASLYEAEVFRRRMQRCPQCGGDLAVYP